MQLSVHGTKGPAAFTKNGTKIIDNKQNKIIDKNTFFMQLALVPSAGLEPADSWFEAKHDIQFHHEGIIITRFINILPKKLKKHKF